MTAKDMRPANEFITHRPDTILKGDFLRPIIAEADEFGWDLLRVPILFHTWTIHALMPREYLYLKPEDHRDVRKEYLPGDEDTLKLNAMIDNAGGFSPFPQIGCINGIVVSELNDFYVDCDLAKLITSFLIHPNSLKVELKGIFEPAVILYQEDDEQLSPLAHGENRTNPGGNSISGNQRIDSIASTLSNIALRIRSAASN